MGDANFFVTKELEACSQIEVAHDNVRTAEVTHRVGEGVEAGNVKQR
jgi:hypothetical protein